jgi:L-lactate dehydrogenase complex protein LldG
MASREQVLRDIRDHLPVDSPLPSLDYSWTRYADPVQQFLEVLRGVGGVGRVIRSNAELHSEITRLVSQLEARQICSVLPETYLGNVDMSAIGDPHQLADIDLAILPGELAVAENAAVWITNRLVSQRVAYFLSQHVALVVPAERVVNNMHEAYELIHREAGDEGPFASPRWGTFMSGPSKTADIEQALVIGAHGARSLHVFLTDAADGALS